MSIQLTTGILQQIKNRGSIDNSNTYVDAVVAYAIANSIDVPPTGYINALNKAMNTIQAYNSGSLLTSADIFRIYAYDGVANNFATINLANPNFAKGTIVDSPLFIAKKGAHPNNAGHINSGYTPSTNAINLTNDSAMLWGYFVDATATSTNTIMGVRGSSGRFNITPYRSATQFEVAVFTTANGEGVATTTGLASNGSVGAISTVAGTITPYRNGVALANLTGISDGALPNIAMFEIGYNNNGVVTRGANNITMSAMYLGAPDAGGQLVLHNSLTTFLNDISTL